MSETRRLRIAVVTLCGALFAGNSVSAAEIRMISAMALHATWLEIVPKYEKMTGDTVTIVWSPGLEVARKVELGEKADLAVLARPGVAELVRKGLLAEGTGVTVAKSLVGVAIRPGAPRPDLSSAASFRKSLLDARSIALSAGTSSIYLRKLFQDLGIAKEIDAKLFKAPGGRPENVANVLRQGDADLGFQQVSELIDEPGIDLIGPIPMELQEVTEWTMALYRDAPHSDRANALIRFIKSPEAAAIIRKHGLQPG